ncbi:STAS/SEC14 domain-containing protein [Pontibacter sp. HSC-14F20]|uniref:STAS/SEC14 domain-containing protein n=1 Tax=Pontibacter sp. HSC-14F20 TaxID=2864136 RepID=UPI001C732D88|nr:STAS/SEC14 domain-containing protein [Pontibacter sp. HSC-14F20]MBX0331820.1 STAS/SEC14 domain-containing protein [Pontibacter sp. HSC-14F20]
MKSPPYFQVSYNRELGLLSSQWLRVGNSTEYRQALINICRQLQKYNACGWLVDFSRMATPNMSDQNWTIELLGHSLPQTRLRKLALVLPDDLFLEVVVEKVSNSLLSMSGNQVQIAQFDDPDTAQQWLICCSDPNEGLFRDAS